MLPHNLTQRFTSSSLTLSARLSHHLSFLSHSRSLVSQRGTHSFANSTTPSRLSQPTRLSARSSLASSTLPISTPLIHRRTFAQPATMVSAAPPPPPSALSQDYGNFKLLRSFTLPSAPVNVSKWRSDKTGLTVTLGHHSSTSFNYC